MAKRSKKKKLVDHKTSSMAPMQGPRMEGGAQKRDLSPLNAKASKIEEKISSLPGQGTVAQMPPWWNCDWLWALILVLGVILAYSPVWWAGYVWDDDAYITDNPCLNGLRGLKDIWTTSAADISPLTFTTFWAEHALWGLVPLPYHLVNVLLHGACAVALWQVLRSLQIPGAWLGAALWALHPVEVESVAWITETKNTQSGLFFLLSILFFVKWLRTKDSDGQNGRAWNYGLTLFFAVLAMASKTSTVILPVALCLCAWWMEGRWRWRDLLRVVPIFIMSAAASALALWTQGLALAQAASPQWVRTWPERLVTAGDAVWFYLGKLIWPHPLMIIYPRWDVDAGRLINYLPLLAVIIVLFVFLLKGDKWARPWFFAFAYFLVLLLPVLGLIDNHFLRYSLVADHFQYLAAMGPLALAGAAIVRLADFLHPGRRWMPLTLGAGMLLILGILSWQRSCAYESAERLWTDTLEKNPDCWLACDELGGILLDKGLLDQAIVKYQKAVEISPSAYEHHYNLGVALAQKGRVDEAMAQFQNAVVINPNFVLAHYNLGVAYSQAGQIGQAIAQFKEALRLKPDFSEAQSNLAKEEALMQKSPANQ